MERKTLGLILAVIPLIAVIAALAIAFAVTGNVGKMVLETGPDEVISGYLTGFSSGAVGDLVQVSGYSLSDDKNTLFLKVVVSNPIDYPLVISSMSYTTAINGQSVAFGLGEEVKVQPESSAEVMLSGDISGQNLLSKMPANPDPTDIASEISFAGIILRNSGGVQ